MNTQEQTEITNNPKVVFLSITELFVGIGAIAVSLLIFWNIAKEVMEKETISFDASIIHLVYALRNPVMTEIMITITFFGSQTFLISAIIFIIIALFRKYKKMHSCLPLSLHLAQD